MLGKNGAMGWITPGNKVESAGHLFMCEGIHVHEATLYRLLIHISGQVFKNKNNSDLFMDITLCLAIKIDYLRAVCIKSVSTKT